MLKDVCSNNNYRELGIPHTNISYAVKHGSVAKGYRWKLSETSND